MESSSASTVSSNERSILLCLMGYPKELSTSKFSEEINPQWDEVLERLITNPEEASILDDDMYPIDYALSIKENPVPAEVIVRLLRTFPSGFSNSSYGTACDNPSTLPEVLRLLRASEFVQERSQLVQLMGFPRCEWDNDYDQESVKPNWNAVRERLITNPEEAKIDEDGCFPLVDALWIESDPVPIDIVDSLIKIHPKGLTDQAFINASHAKTLPGVLKLMFDHDKKQMNSNSEGDDASFVNVQKME